MLVYLLSGFAWGAGYEPVPRNSLERMFAFSQPLRGKQVMDLGSGFGRIVIEATQRYGAEATGIEVDPLKVWWSRMMIRSKGLEGLAKIERGNLLAAKISSTDVLYVFLWTGIMRKLKKKVLEEMKPGGLVVSYYHEFPDWEPDAEDRSLKVYAYRVPGSGEIHA